MEIKVLGTGCASCKALFSATEQAVKELNLDAQVVKEEDMLKIMEYNVLSLPALVVDGKVVAKGKKFNPINISEEGLELIELIALDCENTDGQWHSTTEIKIDKLGYVITNGVKSKNFWDGKIISDKKPLRIKVRNISGDETIKLVR